MTKLWGGRFSEGNHKLTERINSSIGFDKRLFAVDIQGSMAHSAMLAHQGIITEADGKQIAEGLAAILADLEQGELLIDETAEDIHMFVEEELTKRIGEAGKKLHTGRSRNDQVALDLKCYMKNEIQGILSLQKNLCSALLELVEQHQGTLMPGLTHLQKAQPVTFGFHLAAYVEMLERDSSRLEDCCKRLDTMPLGSGALAGTTYPLDREMVARILGFSSITQNAMDAVSDRDHVIELLSVLSIGMMHLSRLAEDLILWSSQSLGYIRFSDGYSTGSSIMPQKKNPDVAELLRGKTGRVYGALHSVLTMMKGLPLSYNKDMQEDKEQLFDAIDTYCICLEILPPMLSTMTVDPLKMEKDVKTGFLNATEMADYLVSKGMSFRDAHEVTGKLVLQAENKGIQLEELELEEMKEISPVFDPQVFQWLDPQNAVERRNLVGGTAPSMIREYIKKKRLPAGCGCKQTGQP